MTVYTSRDLYSGTAHRPQWLRKWSLSPPVPLFPSRSLFALPFFFFSSSALAALFAFPSSCGKPLLLVLPPPFWPISFYTAHSGPSASGALSVFKEAKGFCACVDLARPCNLTSPLHSSFLCATEQASLSFFFFLFEDPV